MNNTAIKNRIDFMVLMDVKNGNPNGDPDANNMPRTDVETGLGFMTDACIKRRIRDSICAIKGLSNGYDIYIRNGVNKESQLNSMYEDLDIKKTDKSKNTKKDKNANKEKRDIKEKSVVDSAVKYVCDKFYDIRTFGCALTQFNQQGIGNGQITGAVQIGFANSIDEISARNIGIVPSCLASESEASEKNGTMGNKWIVPYGLYKFTGSVSPYSAQKTGFSEEDFDLMIEAIKNMCEYTQSASRADMEVQKIIVWKHNEDKGTAKRSDLFNSVKISKNVEYPRDITDYNIDIDEINDGVETIIY